MKALDHAIGLRVIRRCPRPLRSDEVGEGGEKSRLELSPLVRGDRQRRAEQADPTLKESLGHRLRVHIRHRYGGRPPAEPVDDGEAILLVTGQRHLDYVDVHVVEAVVGRGEIAQRCSIVPVDLRSLARFAVTRPARCVLPDARPEEFLRQESRRRPPARV